MGEDLKLFGEVGLGYNQLQKDAETINKLLNDIDKDAKKLGESFKGMKLDPNMKQTAQELQKIQKAVSQLVTNNSQAGQSVNNLSTNLTNLTAVVDRNVAGLQKASKELGNMDMGADAFKAKAKEIEEVIKQQRATITAWAKEKNKINKELSLRDVTQMTLDDYKNNMRSGNKNAQAESADRLKKSLSVLNYEMEKYRNAINNVGLAYEQAKNKVNAFVIEQDKIGKSISSAELQKNLARAQSANYGIGIKENLLKGGVKSVTAKYLDDTQNEIKKIYHIQTDGSVKLIKAVKTTGVASVKELNTQVKSMKQTLKGFESQATKIGKEIDKTPMSKPMEGAGKSIGLALGQLYAMKRALGYVNDEVMKFEKNAVEIQRIAGYTAQEMDKLKDASFDMAKNIGLNVNTIQEIEGLWARAGKGGQALVEATKTTALGFNVAEFKDAESAVASMNSIINQMYNGDATKAPEILDALTKVADKTAVRNVNDLVEVVSRAGANAKSLGMNLHELNAASSVVMERMKLTGDVLGTQFKTIFAYMADGKRIDKLKKYGVEFTNIGKDGTESLKPFMEMMDNLVAKYNELKKQGKDVMANDMIKNLSGVRNVATLKNLVEGWGSMRDRILLSQNSKGFAERQNAKMMETYAKKVEQLKVAFQELAVSIGDAGLLDAMKWIADKGKDGTEFFSKYSKEIMTVVKAVLAYKLAIKGLDGVNNILQNGLFSSLAGKDVTKNIKSLMPALIGGNSTVLKSISGDIYKSMNEGVVQAGGVTAKGVPVITKLTMAFSGLKATAVKTGSALLGLVNPITICATALGGLMAYFAYKKYKRLQILEDFTSGKADEAIGNIRALKQELDDITNTQAYKQGDATAMDAYKSTTEELARVLGIANSVTIGNKDSMDLYNKSLSVAVDLKEREYELNKKIAGSEARKGIEKMAKTGIVGADGRVEASQMAKDIARYKSSLKEVQTLHDDIVNGNGNPEKLRTKLDSATDNLAKDEITLNQRIQKLKEYQAQAGMTNEEVAKLFEGQTYDNVPIADIIDEFISKAPDAKDGMDKIAEGAKNAKEETEAFEKSVNQLLDSFNKITKQTDVIGSAFQELKDNGKLSNGTVMKLLEADPDMAKYITETKDGYTLLSGAIEHYKDKQEEANETTQEALNKYRERVGLMKDENGNLVNLPSVNSVDSSQFQEELNKMVNASKDGMSEIKTSFEDGKTSVADYLDKIRQANDDERSKLILKLDTTQLSALNSELGSELKSKLDELAGQFTSGAIDINKYADSIIKTKDEALDLYVALNNLHQNANGAWVDQTGKINEFATAISKSNIELSKTKGAFADIMTALENAPNVSAVISGQDLEIPEEEIKKFADTFTTSMNTLKENNTETWNTIVATIAEQTGMSVEETEKCLTNSDEFVKNQHKMLSSSIGTVFGALSQVLGLSDAAVATYARKIGSKIASLASKVMGWVSQINQALGEKALNFSIAGKLDKFGIDLGDKWNDKLKNSDYEKAINKISKNFTDNADYFKKKKAEFEKQGIELAKSVNADGGNAVNQQQLQDILRQINEQNNTQPNTRTGGRKGSGSKSSSDVPKAVEDALEDLRHELEMGRISEDQFYKGVEKLYNNNSGKMSKRGKQKFEKMLKDAKTKADSSIPPYAKVLIDDLEDQLKYGEIDQYTYSSKLDDIARRYKNKLGKKAIKDIEKKISEAKVGGLDKYFKSQIDEFESIIKVSDLAVKKIQAEQSLYQALNMGDTSGMSLQGAKINIINNKLFATEALAKKYESVLKVINEEVKKLDKNSSSYKNTLHGLATKQEEFTNKLNETRVAIIDLQKQRIEEQMKVYDAMQKKYDDAVSSMEQIESKLVTFIQQRNQKIREQIDKNHKAKMDALDKETKARDKELEKEKKRLQDALEAYRKYTQGKIDSLDKEAEKEDYNKELKKKMDERDELQYRINSLSLDDTSTARGKRIELTKQLADKNNEIEEFQKDRARKLTKEGLQDQLKDYEESLEKKQKKLDDQSKKEQEQLDDRRKSLEEEHQRELALLDEKMKASFVYAEAKQAILSGYVQDATGASVAIRDAMIQGMEEQGQASGILREKYINDLDAVIRKAHEAQQIMGMARSSAGAGSLQARLGLTDEGYQEYLGSKANQLGFSVQDTERYIQNKLGWSGASASERKRLANENHQLRAKYAGDPKNWDNKNVNIDKNGEVLGMDWILDTGSAMKVGQSFGQHTPLGGNFGRDEARNTAMADLGLYNSRTRGSSEAFFTNQMNQFKRMGMSYSQPNLSTWTSGNYYDNWKKHSDILNRFERTPSDISDYAGALGYIRSYKEDLQNNFNNDQTGMGFPSDSGDNSTREALMSAAKAQDGMPYSQGSERYSTHRDCSSYVYFAVKNAGLYGGDGFYTGDMIPKLAQYGWQDLGHIPKEQIRRGDIFWIRDGKHNHTEIATQDGTLNSTGAHSARKPAGPSVWSYDYRILRHPKINGYSQGGIADYTGVAMLHGTKSSPEYIFNAPQFDALGRMIANYVSAPAIYGHGVYNGTTSSLPEINIDTLINIEGNADQNTVREIERQSDEILDKLIIGLKKRGVRR